MYFFDKILEDDLTTCTTMNYQENNNRHLDKISIRVFLDDQHITGSLTPLAHKFFFLYVGGGQRRVDAASTEKTEKRSILIISVYFELFMIIKQSTVTSVHKQL